VKAWSLKFGELGAIVNYDHNSFICDCVYHTHNFVCTMQVIVGIFHALLVMWLPSYANNNIILQVIPFCFQSSCLRVTFFGFVRN
jgi:hypothetical protein